MCNSSSTLKKFAPLPQQKFPSLCSEFSLILAAHDFIPFVCINSVAKCMSQIPLKLIQAYSETTCSSK